MALHIELGHNYSQYVYDNNATCTQNGTETCECSRCHDKITRVKLNSALGHICDNYYKQTLPTCTKNSIGTGICKRCGVKFQAQIPYTALGHKIVLKNKKSPTCFSEGYTGDYVCAVCGKIELKGNTIAKKKVPKPSFSLIKGNKKLTIKISKVKIATSYEIQVKIKGKWKKFSTTKLKFSVSKLKAKTTYYVRVRSVSKKNSNKAYSAYSNIKKINTK